MNVVSPFTRSSNCSHRNNLALPANGVIYVQNVPSATADPNYTAGCTNPSTGLAFNVTAPGGGVTRHTPSVTRSNTTPRCMDAETEMCSYRGP